MVRGVRGYFLFIYFFFQAEDGIRDHCVTGVQDVCSSDLAHSSWYNKACRYRNIFLGGIAQYQRTFVLEDTWCHRCGQLAFFLRYGYNIAVW